MSDPTPLNATLSASDSIQVAPRSPQPRVAGLLLAFVSGLLFFLVTLAILFASQQVRISAAIETTDTLLRNDSMSSDDRRERLMALRSFMDSFQSVDRVLRSLTAGSYRTDPQNQSPHDAFQYEDELLQRLTVTHAALSRSPQGHLGKIPELLLRPPSSSTTHQLEDASSTHTQGLIHQLEGLIAEDQKISTSREKNQASVEALIERARLIQLEAQRFFSLPEAPDALSTLANIADISATLYQSGLLRGVPMLEGLPDDLSTPDALLAAVDAIGGKTVVAPGRRQSDVQADLSNITHAGAELIGEVERLLADERMHDEQMDVADKNKRAVLRELQLEWLTMFRRRLLLRSANTNPLTSVMGVLAEYASRLHLGVAHEQSGADD